MSNATELNRFVYDDSEAMFETAAEMSNFVSEREAHTEWHEVPANKLSFEPLFEEPLCASQYTAKGNGSFTDEAVKDSMSTTNLMVNSLFGIRPVGLSAVACVVNRAGLRFDGFKKLSDADHTGGAEDEFGVRWNPECNALVGVLNTLMKASTGMVQVKIADEKVRAINSSRYTVLRSDKLLAIAERYFNDNWPDATFKTGYFSHDGLRAVMDLSAYKAQFMAKVPDKGIFRTAEPAVVLVSSDTATSAVTLVPSLNVNGNIFPLTREISVKHIGEDLEGRVENAMEKILAYFQDATEDIQELTKVKLDFGDKALKRILTNSGIPVKCACEAIDAYQALYGESQVTAMDVYLAVVDAYTNVVREYPNDKKKVFLAADAVARAARTRWADVDLPGDVMVQT